MSGTFSSVKSLRRDPHSCKTDCWLHMPTFLSVDPSTDLIYTFEYVATPQSF